MTTLQKAALLKSMQRMDWEMRLRFYPPVLESERGAEVDEDDERADELHEPLVCA